MQIEKLVDQIVREVIKNLDMTSQNSYSDNTNKSITVKDIANVIDHSLLRPNLSDEEIIEGCKIAKDYGCISVCVRPTDLPIVKRELAGTNVLITTVIGFPHGSNSTETKVFETIEAIKAGAVEVDMVLNIGKMLSGDYVYVRKDIQAVVDAAHKLNAIVKVIFENAYLNDQQKEIACKICEETGADFVKTSTGYAPSGATIDDLKLMRRVCSPRIRVKAAGGVSNLDAALAVIATGTVRIGTRSTKEIIEEAKKRERMGELKISTSGKLGSGY